jgi:hypothetical protein
MKNRSVLTFARAIMGPMTGDERQESYSAWGSNCFNTSLMANFT